MRQQPNPESFVSNILARPMTLGAGRLSKMVGDTPIAQPATRRDKSAPAPMLSLHAVKAIATLADGSARVRFVAGADPALVCSVRANGRTTDISYRMRDDQIVSSGLMAQDPNTAVVLAARLLIARAPEFSAAYDAFLKLYLDPQSDEQALEQAAAHAADELCLAIDADLKLDASVDWYYQANDADMRERNDPAALPLDDLFSKPDELDKWRAGDASAFTLLASAAPSVTTAATPVTDSANAFFGPQKDQAVRFMRDNFHILHHGPTGTGKSYVWEQAMREIDPAFDPDTHPYFVHGSAGLEDIDFTGNYVLRPNGQREWVDGPLVRAMKDGKRFKVEEMNRLPGAMLNILLGAMDYGRISLPRYDGQIVTAKEGFAVDAMANIGREYTATDDIDPAVMRRFNIKIEYDFLSADQELRLLRSRQPDLDVEDGKTLIKIANAVRDAYETGGGSDLDVDLYVSPAALLQTARLMAQMDLPIAEAIELTWMVDVARTKEKRESVRAMIDQNVRDRGKPVGKPKRARP